jgi:hypothetical protein
MKKLLFLGACLVALASQPVMAQASGPDVLVVRVVEIYGRTLITIERAGQEPEEIIFDWNGRPGKGARASKGYYDALARFYQQGYQTQAIIPGSHSSTGEVFTTIFLTKPTGK